MKTCAVIMSVLALAALNVSAAPGVAQPAAVTTTLVQPKPLVEIVSIEKAVTLGKNQLLCNLCVQEMVAIINEVLNDILNGVVLKSCSQLCNHFNNSTKNICNIACDLVGIKELVKILNSTDPDEIYVCDNLGMCIPGNCTGNGDGSSCLSIDSVSAPPENPFGADINVVADITVKEPLATGMTRIRVFDESEAKPGKPVPFTQSDALNFNWPVGSVSAKINVNSDSQNPLTIGKYVASVEICEGSCGSKKPNSSVYDTKNVSFEVVNSGPVPPGPPAPPAPPAPPGAHHYGDPAKGACLSDETKVQIQGLPGDFCSPKCTGTTCPTDVPDGASATPKCVLETQGSNKPTQCALICTPSNNAADGSNVECPTDATCKSIQGTGLCTYND